MMQPMFPGGSLGGSRCLVGPFVWKHVISGGWRLSTKLDVKTTIAAPVCHRQTPPAAGLRGTPDG